MSIRLRCKYLVFLALICLASVLTGPATQAQGGVAGDVPVPPKPKSASPADAKIPKESPQIRVESSLVTAPVTVIDRAGEYVYDLQEGDFQVYDNGVPQRIARFGIEQQALAAVIVIESNDTVAPLLDQVRPLGPLFSDLMLGPQGKAAVLTYGDRVRQVLDFTDNADQLDTALRKIKADGRAARLNDALARAVSLLEMQPKEERRIIVTFSEGADRGSENSKDDIVRRAANAEVTIYGLGFNPVKALLSQKQTAPPPNPLDTNVTRPVPPNSVPTPTEEERVYSTPIPVVPIMTAAGEVIRSAVASSLLEFYAGYTGGVYYSHWGKNTLQGQLNRVASEIHSQYELAYVPDTLAQMGFHRIEVRVRRSGLKVRTRAGYFYGGTTSAQ